MKTFLDIKIGDIVVVYDKYGHDYEEHRVKVDHIEFDKGFINGEYNPKGMRCYGIDLDFWNEETQEYNTDEYISVVTEGNFVMIEEQSMKGGDTMKLYINYNTGVGNEWIEVKTTKEAKEIAEKNACYTQKDICIENEKGKIICKLPWWGIEYNSNSEDVCVVDFGQFGYYGEWINYYFM